MSKKKRVLFIGSFVTKSSSGHVGGQMFACNSLVNSDITDDVDWILLDTTATTNLKRSFGRRFYNALKRITVAFYYILFGRIDTVMAFCSSGFSFLEKGTIIKIAKFFKKKTILAPRSGFLIDDITKSISFRKKANRIFNSTDIIICQGKFWRDFFEEQFQINKTRLPIINNWLDTSVYNNQKRVPSDKLNILFLGWIESNKGIWDLLDAIEELKMENLKLKIAGHGKEFNDFTRAIREKDLDNKIEMLGWIHGEDKFNLLNSSDVFVLPSYREGLPNSMLEAMASKCAIIVSDVGATSDIISNEYNGFLIKSGDSKSIASSIKRYLNDKNLLLLHQKRALITVNDKNTLSAALPKFKSILS